MISFLWHFINSAALGYFSKILSIVMISTEKSDTRASVEAKPKRIQTDILEIVKLFSKYCMLGIVWIHCYLLTKSSHAIILSRILHYINQWAHCVLRDAPIRLALCSLGR